MEPPQDDPQQKRTFDPTDARQGEIILRRPWQRWTFAAGLIGIVLLALIMIGWQISG